MKITPTEFDLIRSYIEGECGISIPADKQYLVETRLTRLVAENGCRSFGEFHRKVTTGANRALRDRIVDAMTTNETLWFRDGSPWVAMRDQVLPVLARAAPGSRKIRIWSAACSTGQEPYTIAMLIDHQHRVQPARALPPSRFEIVATDISPSALFIAMAGRYDRISMSRGLTGDWAPFKSRYFTDQGRVSVLSEDLRKRVVFKRFNLQNSFTTLGRFDVVFMRNVAIYFSDSFKRTLFDRVANTLNPSGLLFLGSAETLTSYSNRFEAVEHGRAVIYRRKR